MSSDRQLIREFKAIGSEELGLQGSELRAYVQECLKERLELAKIEAERKERLELAKIEAEEREKQRGHELEMERLRLKHEVQGCGVQGEDGPVTGRQDGRRPAQLVMPSFNEKEDVVDNFLKQFEKLALLHQVPREQWAISVSAFLQGSAKEVYHNMAPQEADDYVALKKALLRHYQLSAESFRKLFRESQKRITETHGQYHARVRILFDKWIKMTETELTYEGLREEVLKEQVLGTYRKDLLVFLAERKLLTLDEIGEMAERYELAHSNTTHGHGRERSHYMDRGRKVGPTDRPRDDRRKPDGVGRDYNPGEGKGSGAGRTSPRPKGKVVCYGCRKPGHILRDCKKVRQPQVNSVSVLGSMKSFPVSTGNTAQGLVNGYRVTLLYDTGCSYPALVSAKYCRPEDYTGRTIAVKFANCTEAILPVVMIDLESSYVRGRIEAACMEGLSHDLILGCRYVLPQPNPVYGAPVPVASVTTRAQRDRTSPRPLRNTLSPIANVSSRELKELQRADSTLTTLYRHAEEGSVKRNKRGEVQFTVKNGTLYRYARKGNEHY